MGHFIKYCESCGVVIGQCRCPSKDKEILWGLCEDCKQIITESGDKKNGKK